MGAKFDIESYRRISFLDLPAYCLMKLFLRCVKRCRCRSVAVRKACDVSVCLEVVRPAQ
jgi:hypothetical protein